MSIFVKVNVVCGGLTDGQGSSDMDMEITGDDITDSCELNKGDGVWEIFVSLPLNLFSLGGVTLDNRVFMLGNTNQGCI